MRAVNHDRTRPGPLRRPGVPAYCFAGLLGMTAIVAHAGPPRPDHPLLGAWQIAVPDTSCTETYMFRRDGTSLVTSAEEVSQSEYTIADKPSAKGYYKWVDKIVKDNGKKDCQGAIMETGKPVTNYVLFNEAKDKFLMCAAEDLHTCIGPAVRIEANDT
jgi:hypothetical protein